MIILLYKRYINNNPTFSYRRNEEEGDYPCSKEEYIAMVRDSSIKTSDMLILSDMDFSAFNLESIHIDNE